MPDSVLIPAPVSTAIRSEAATEAETRSISLSTTAA
jgi:hypothetical protein